VGDVVIDGVQIEENTYYGIILSNLNAAVRNCTFKNVGHVASNANACIVYNGNGVCNYEGVGNRFINDLGVKEVDWLLNFGPNINSGSRVLVDDNFELGTTLHSAGVPVNTTGMPLANIHFGKNHWRNGAGTTLYTENFGKATVLNGTTSIAVTHNYLFTPSLDQIIVTPQSTWGSMAKFWISGVTATQFTINCDVDPGQNVDFSWSIKNRG